MKSCGPTQRKAVIGKGGGVGPIHFFKPQGWSLVKAGRYTRGGTRKFWHLSLLGIVSHSWQSSIPPPKKSKQKPGGGTTSWNNYLNEGSKNGYASLLKNIPIHWRMQIEQKIVKKKKNCKDDKNGYQNIYLLDLGMQPRKGPWPSWFGLLQHRHTYHNQAFFYRGGGLTRALLGPRQGAPPLTTPPPLGVMIFTT